jgi:hypothetical protein
MTSYAFLGLFNDAFSTALIIIQRRMGERVNGCEFKTAVLTAQPHFQVHYLSVTVTVQG